MRFHVSKAGAFYFYIAIFAVPSVRTMLWEQHRLAAKMNMQKRYALYHWKCQKDLAEGGKGQWDSKAAHVKRVVCWGKVKKIKQLKEKGYDGLYSPL